MKKKICIGVGILLMILIVAGIVTNYIDSGRVATGHEPKYCIKIVNNDGSKVTYWGLGYKVIRYVGVSQNEPYESNIGVKMGNWFMKYKLPIDSEFNKENSSNISNLNDFYNTELTKNRDIRNLSKEYTSFDAQKDNCFVIGAMVHNDNLYSEFMENYKNKKTAFIRVAQNTVEGDLILTDILYYEKSDKLYIVTDNTRDKFSAETDRIIELKEFNYTSEYKNNNHLYWVLYNEDITEENFKTDNVFVITTINKIYKGDIKVMNKEKLKVKIFLILSLVFAILTLIGGYLVITHKLDNAGYSVIPMLFTLTFSILYRNSKKDKE